MKAELPHNELSRLAALASYQILDTMPEQAFDDLTSLASQICGTPITLVSLIDQDRQWFKSRIGLDVEETARDISFCAHAILSPEELLVVPDARQDPRFCDNPAVTGEMGIRFYAGSPLVTENGEALGTLCVVDTRPRELSEGQKHALRVLSRQVMAQLELKRHYAQTINELAYRIQVEEALRESQNRFQAFMDHSPVLAFLQDEDRRFVYVNQPFLDRYGLKREEVIGKGEEAVWRRSASSLLRHDQGMLDQRVLDQGVIAGEDGSSRIEAVEMPDGQMHYWQVWRFCLQRGGGSGRYLAGIALDVTETKRYEQQLKQYQQQLEDALVLVEAQSLTDALTGLNNRRSFARRLDEVFSFSKRYSQPLSVLMLDVDKFKQFNDTFGHPAGDEVLRKVARVLKETARAADFVARYGGEEFVMLLPNTDTKGAFLLAERFRRAIESLPWDKRAITVSMGVASISPQTVDGDALVEMADRALYEAKNSGRNTVVQAL